MTTPATDFPWLRSGERCTATRHHVLASGPLSLFLTLIVDSALHDRVLLTWASVGDREAWWCYSCGAWGVSRFSIVRPSFSGTRPQEG